KGFDGSESSLRRTLGECVILTCFRLPVVGLVSLQGSRPRHCESPRTSPVRQSVTDYLRPRYGPVRLAAKTRQSKPETRQFHALSDGNHPFSPPDRKRPRKTDRVRQRRFET